MALVVFTGGARSGKSAAAQALAVLRAADGVDVTVAVFGRGSDDPEYADRIAAHRAARPVGWSTLEVADSAGWPTRVPNDRLLLVDCVGTMLGQVMEESFAAIQDASLGDAAADALPPGFADEFSARFEPLLSALLERAGDAIVVTNEVGDGIVPGYASGRFFRDELGRANRRLVERADAAYLCVAGRLIDLLALPQRAGWPDD